MHVHTWYTVNFKILRTIWSYTLKIYVNIFLVTDFVLFVIIDYDNACLIKIVYFAPMTAIHT